MPYCPQCGAATEPESAFCSACGSRLEGQAQAQAPTPTSPTPTSPPRGGRNPWSLFGGAVVLAALVVGGVALYDAAANDGDWGESLFGGDGEEAVVAAASPTPEPTVRLFPTVEPTTTAEVPPPEEPTIVPSPEETTIVPPAVGYATPEEAISAWFERTDTAYVGDCETANLDTDVGSYCSLVWEDWSDTIIYVVGLTFSEPDTWLLLAQVSEGDDWAVVDIADFVPGPQDTVPPWP